jgi:D-psicose/D-tagatose/L-ribulose 3-epimerase
MNSIGISTWVWIAPLTTDAFVRLGPHIASLGFDSVEVPIEGLADLDYPRVRAIADQAGLAITTCGAFGPDRDLISDDPSVRDQAKQYVRHCVDAAVVLGAPAVVGPMYSAVGRTWRTSDDERRAFEDLLVQTWTELARYAGDRGVVLGIEPLNRFETSVINLAEQVMTLVERVDHPSCGVLLDTFHMNIEERSIGDAIRRVGSRLVQLHACENDRGAAGSGHVPWDDVVGACRDIGFAGPLVIESFTDKVVSIARAAAIWRPLAESPDALAREGLAFLRSRFGAA